MSNLFYIYEHWRLDRDECFYVGKGKGNRAYNLSNRNRHHKAIMAKLHREGFAMEIKIVASGIDEETAFSLEKERIAFWRNAGCDLVNMTTGGEGLAGLKFSIEHREKLSNSRNRQVMSPEQKNKISLALKGRKKNPLSVVKSNAAKIGKKASAATREKMSLAHAGKPRKPLSEQTKAKISAAHMGKIVRPETKQKLSSVTKRNWDLKKSQVTSEG
jgi:NUMOD3 motif